VIGKELRHGSKPGGGDYFMRICTYLEILDI
jgi:hypothetical protein